MYIIYFSSPDNETTPIIIVFKPHAAHLCDLFEGIYCVPRVHESSCPPDPADGLAESTVMMKNLAGTSHRELNIPPHTASSQSVFTCLEEGLFEARLINAATMFGSI